MHKIFAGVAIALALVIGAVPQLTDCQSQGKALTLPSGKTIPMRCHWTASAELAVAVPLLGLGVFMALARRKESRRFLAVLGVVEGAFALLLPTALVGVCPNPEMLCSSVMRPTLVLAGIVVIAVGAAALVAAARQPEPAA